MAPGRAATVAGYTALFIGAMEPVANLAGAQTGNRLEERLTHRAKPKLPTVGEPGCLPFRPKPRSPKVWPTITSNATQPQQMRRLDPLPRDWTVKTEVCCLKLRYPFPAGICFAA